VFKCPKHFCNWREGLYPEMVSFEMKRLIIISLFTHGQGPQLFLRFSVFLCSTMHAFVSLGKLIFVCVCVRVCVCVCACGHAYVRARVPSCVGLHMCCMCPFVYDPLLCYSSATWSPSSSAVSVKQSNKDR
jgi:hypothetical protein